MLRAIQYLLLTAYLTISIALYQKLPDRFPIHFNINGVADGWADKSILSWFALPLIATALVAMFNAIGSLAANKPQLWNIPKKTEFLTLSPEARRPITQMMENFMTLTAICLLLLFISLQISMYQVAAGLINTMPWHTTLGLILILGVVVGGSIVFTVRVRRAVDEALRAGR